MLFARQSESLTDPTKGAAPRLTGSKLAVCRVVADAGMVLFDRQADKRCRCEPAPGVALDFPSSNRFRFRLKDLKNKILATSSRFRFKILAGIFLAALLSTDSP